MSITLRVVKKLLILMEIVVPVMMDILLQVELVFNVRLLGARPSTHQLFRMFALVPNAIEAIIYHLALAYHVQVH